MRMACASSSSTILFESGVWMNTDDFESSTNPIVVPFLVTIAFFLFSLVSCDRSAGGVFFEPYIAPRITAWRGSSLKNPTTTSSPGSGRKNEPRPLPASGAARQEHFDTILFGGILFEPINNADLQATHGRQQAGCRRVGQIRPLGQPL